MSAEPLVLVAPCEAKASLVVEVERTDGLPLGEPVSVHLSGAAAKTMQTSGDPARAIFESLDPGKYTIELELAGEVAEFEVLADEPLTVELAEDQQTAVRIDIEGDDAWEVTDAATLHEDEPADEDEDDEEEDEDDWEVTSAEAADEE